MKILEITSNARKIIKNLNSEYISYVLDYRRYDHLISLLHQYLQHDDQDVQNAIKQIFQKLEQDILRMLSTTNNKE